MSRDGISGTPDPRFQAVCVLSGGPVRPIRDSNPCRRRERAVS
mgnify:CR=1 FL=1